MAKLEYETLEIIPGNRGFIYNCIKCSYITKSWFYIRNHIKRHTDLKPLLFDCGNSSPETFFCKNCNFETYSTISFNVHIKYHKVPNNVIATDQQKIEKYPDENNEKKHEVPQNGLFQCNKTRSKLCFKEHCCNYTSVEDTNEEFNCKKCPYKAKNQYHLERHVKNKHTPLNDLEWFHCDKCSYKSKEKGILKTHMVNQHTVLDAIRWFYCTKCSYKSKQKGCMKTHMTNKHTTVKDITWFHCDQCSYKSKQKGCLKSHVNNKHTKNVKQFHCAECKFRTKKEDSLMRHTQKRHAQNQKI